MSESFYPFVENNQAQDGDDIAAPSYTARIAVYDSMVVPPRVVTVPPSDVRTYLDEITKNVWELSTQQGGEWPFHIIRELVENYIHASFIEPTISIMDKGQTISFSDQGPGIPNKEAALRPTFSSATKAMKRYIRGTGSGLPMVEATVRLQHGTISIEDNLGQGAVITVSLAHKEQQAQPAPEQPLQAAGWGQQTMSAAPQAPTGWPTQPQMGMQMGQAGQMPFPTTYPQGQGIPQNMAGMPYYQTPGGYIQQPQPPMQAEGGAPAPHAPATQAGWPGYTQQAVYPTYQGQPMTQPAFSNPWAPQQGMQAYAAPEGQDPTQAFAGRSVPATAACEQPTVFSVGAQPPGFQPQQPAQGAPQRAALNEEVAQVLRLFLDHERIGATEASEALGFSKSTGTRRIQEACEAGFIVKTGQKYVLTAAGQMVVSEMAEGR